MKKDVSNDELNKTMNLSFKIFRLTHDGPEEFDFVEWASDLNRNHPIAKDYQN